MIPLIPVAITIAILRHQLLDIRLVVSRALLYGLLTAAAAGAYVGLVALLDALVRSRVSLDSRRGGQRHRRDRVQPGPGPAAAADRPRRCTGTAATRSGPCPWWASGWPGPAPPGCPACSRRCAIRCGCRSRRCGSGPLEAAAYGTAPELLHSISLSYDGARIGELIVGLRSGQRRLSPPDIAVLELLAGPLAVALHATALSAALQESRVGIVAAREEERRRLRRDLHDGLGPALTGIAFKADAARNTLPAEPAQASELLGELRADTTAAIADIRRLVYALRPPALDDLGLIGSLRQQSPGSPSAPTAAASPSA